MGLSPDPDKRARQLANLSRGFPAAAARHGLEHPPHDPEPHNDQDDGRDGPPAGDPPVEVIDYDPEPAPEPPERRPGPSRPPRPRRPRPPDPGPAEPDTEPRSAGRGGFGGFLDGFIGG